MRISRRFGTETSIIASLVAAASASAILLSPANPQASVPLVKLVDGPLASGRPSTKMAWASLTPGPLPIPSDFRADDKAHLSFANGGTVVADKGAEVRLMGALPVTFSSTKRTHATVVELHKGRINVEMPASAVGRSVLVSWGKETFATFLPGSRGWATLRSAEKDGVSSAEATELIVVLESGEAQVAGKRTWQGMSGPRAARLSPSPSSVELVELPASPTFQEILQPYRVSLGPKAEVLALVTNIKPKASPQLRWQPVAGAKDYRLEIAKATDPTFSQPIALSTVKKPEAASPPLERGAYLIRVVGRNELGFFGQPSEPLRYRVARVMLPPGSVHASANQWWVPRSSRLKLSEPGGLELALGPGGFMAAPSHFGITADDHIDVRLRSKGSSSAAAVRVAELPTRAEISLSPRSARWPETPVTISVELKDRPKGQASFTPSMEVRINNKVAAVTWEKTKDNLRATIPPRSGSGPWVIRVRALDPFGNELGYNFVEVISSQQFNASL